jgi:hypothetical protein
MGYLLAACIGGLVLVKLLELSSQSAYFFGFVLTYVVLFLMPIGPRRHD